MTFDPKELRRIEQSLEKIGQAFREMVQTLTMELRVKAMQKTPVATGHLIRTWSNVDFNYGGYSFGNKAAYAPVLETGGYPGVGPRTVQTERGIFSKQAPDGMLAPLLEDRELEETVERIFIEKMNEVFS